MADKPALCLRVARQGAALLIQILFPPPFVRLHMDGQPERVLHAGESVALPDRAIHNEGAIDKPVKLNAVYVVEKGKPLASPAQ